MNCVPLTLHTRTLIIFKSINIKENIIQLLKELVNKNFNN